jgi:ADP-heptose:LPS heptosyltransferase
MKKKKIYLEKVKQFKNLKNFENVNRINDCDLIITSVKNFKKNCFELKKKKKTIMDTQENILFVILFF